MKVLLPDSVELCQLWCVMVGISSGNTGSNLEVERVVHVAWCTGVLQWWHFWVPAGDSIVCE